MARVALISAAVTGAFCALFALVLSQVAPQLTMAQLICASFISGFSGSLVARIVLRT